MKIPNVYITKDAIFMDGEKMPGIIRDDPQVLPGKRGNILNLSFFVSNVVVEGDGYEVQGR